MPNWHTNAIATHKENLPLLVNDEGNMDFQKLCPMPESLNIISGSIQNDSIRALSCKNEEEFIAKYNRRSLHFPITGSPFSELPFPVNNFEDLQKLGQLYLDNEKKYGFTDWYGWCNENWGCKWNASDSFTEEHDDIVVISFETPWGPPNPDMFVSALKNAEHKGFYIEHYDEDYWGIACITVDGNWSEYGEIDPCIFKDKEYKEKWKDKNGNVEIETYRCAIRDIQWDKLGTQLDSADAYYQY